MPEAVRKMLQNSHRDIDETDKIPENLEITNLDLLMYIVAIIGHIIDLFIDLNVALKYFMASKLIEFGWTLSFILFPAFVNTAISIRMYSLDKGQEDTVNKRFTKMKILRIFILIFQMSPILHFIDALIYASKSRASALKNDQQSRKKYYRLMLKADSDAALVRIIECFLEAAPQQVLQLTYLYRLDDQFKVHQILSIVSSTISMGWCLAAYQRAIRFVQEDKQNMNWIGSLLQTVWHFFVSLSRIVSISIIGWIFPHWTVLVCITHAFIMATWLQFFDRSPFCAQNRLAELAWSIILGLVYIFTYILPIEGRTRYRYSIYYSVCFIENIVCAVIWILFARYPIKDTVLYFIVAVLSVIPYVLGLMFMVIYYEYYHPKVRKGVRNNKNLVYVAEEIETQFS